MKNTYPVQNYTNSKKNTNSKKIKTFRCQTLRVVSRQRLRTKIILRCTVICTFGERLHSFRLTGLIPSSRIGNVVTCETAVTCDQRAEILKLPVCHVTVQTKFLSVRDDGCSFFVRDKLVGLLVSVRSVRLVSSTVAVGLVAREATSGGELSPAYGTAELEIHLLHILSSGYFESGPRLDLHAKGLGDINTHGESRLR